MQDIRMIAFDLDDTLLTTGKRLTPRTRRILELTAERGIELLPTTGRSLTGIPDAVKSLAGCHYALTANGSGVYRRKSGPLHSTNAGTGHDSRVKDAPDEVLRYMQNTAPAIGSPDEGKPSFEIDADLCYELIYEKNMDPDTTRQLMRELAPLSIMPDPFIDGACYMRADKTHLIERMDVNQAMKDYIWSSRTLVEDMDSFLSGKNIQKITINFAADENGDRIDLAPTEEILKKYPDFTAVTGGIRNIEVSDAHATKGDAMLWLADHLGIHTDQIIAFGDSENDITMLKAAGTGVAMANALDITIEAADEVTQSNDDEGVAIFLEKCLHLQ